MLVGAGLVAGAAWVTADELSQPTEQQLAQRACIAEVANTANQADDAGSLASQAADCSVQDL